MQNPFVLIVEAADFVMRSVLNVYLSFLLFVVAIGLASRLAARLLSQALPLNWRTAFVNLCTVFGVVIAVLTAPRLLYHAPNWLR
ncbi:MAG: hypothetical protein JWR16_2203 [Nevskia sp.]|nr:hypothetical protein [Nevskia sp.]